MYLYLPHTHTQKKTTMKYAKTTSRNDQFATLLTTLFFLILTVSKPVASQNCGCASGLCCSSAGYCGTTDAYCGEGCKEGPCKNSGPGDPTVSLEETVTPEFFNSILSQATESNCPGKGFYTRETFMAAASAYPSFGASISKREIAAFFAHVAQETGFMCHIEEVDGPAKAARGEYCDTTKPEFPCVQGKGYYGRGAIQLSWNYNYGPCGRDLNEGDLLATPEKVAQNQVLAFKASFWYWTTNVRSSFKSGFGATIRAVNSRECSGGDSTEKAANRVRYFQDYCGKLGVQPGENLTC
ncbi:PREDICTED: basic endochitinase CHB4-like [Brassica oleracea var. oleracea]|nr:PREDICTED: basic endochitinase CHB4-like [Brassica oleracea var. oleracea]